MGTETMTPADATHVGPGGVAYKSTGASCLIWTGNLWSLIRDLPAQAVQIKREWNGEGLPPIGTVCEFGERRFIVKVLTHVIGMQPEPIAVSQEGETGPLCMGVAKYFHPIRTADQIAAEERETNIQALSLDAGSPIPNASQRAVAERLIDAGWIKPCRS